jgi:Na+/H+ antiporter NhaD/arsenite permease-like protein
MRKNNVFEVELRIYQQSMKKEKYYFPNSYDSIYYKESLMLLANCMIAFGLLILQGFHIKQEELICQKLILILQGSFCLVRILQQSFLLGIFHYHIWKRVKNNLRLLFYLFLLF